MLMSVVLTFLLETAALNSQTMRTGSKSRLSDQRKVGETAIGTCVILTLLVVVAFVASYSAVNAVLGGSPIDDTADFSEDLSNTIVSKVHLILKDFPSFPKLHHSCCFIFSLFSQQDQVDASSISQEDENCCRGLKHVELWGEATNWGADNLVKTAEDCCTQCRYENRPYSTRNSLDLSDSLQISDSGSNSIVKGKKHIFNIFFPFEQQFRDICKPGKECKCNSWVFCEDEKLCTDKYRQVNLPDLIPLILAVYGKLMKFLKILKKSHELHQILCFQKPLKIW